MSEMSVKNRLLNAHIGIIGGIEPTFLEGCTMEQLDECVENLLGIMQDKRFILGNSDSCPPNVAYEKFLRVSELVKNKGR